MSAVDLGVYAILSLSLLAGFSRGLALELATTISWSAAILPLLVFVVYAGDILSANGFRRYVEVGGALALFIAFLIILRLTLRDFYAGLHRRRVSLAERLAGLAFGFFRGLTAVLIAFLIFERSIDAADKDAIIADSRTHAILAGLNMTLGLTPKVELDAIDLSRP